MFHLERSIVTIYKQYEKEKTVVIITYMLLVWGLTFTWFIYNC
jgi:hypothetical protein